MPVFDRFSRRSDEQLLALAIRHTPYNRELGRFDPTTAEHIAPLWTAIRDTPRGGATLVSRLRMRSRSGRVHVGGAVSDAGEKILSRSTQRSFKRVAAEARRDGNLEGAVQLEKLIEAGAMPRKDTT